MGAKSLPRTLAAPESDRLASQTRPMASKVRVGGPGCRHAFLLGPSMALWRVAQDRWAVRWP